VNKNNYSPNRIVCLTEEPTETLYLLGEENRIVGISTFTVRPPQARKEKPVVSSFLDAHINKILDLKPDLVIGFSDIQSGIAEQLIKKGITVWINNYRDIKGIKNMVFQLGSIVGKQNQAKELISSIDNKLLKISLEIENWVKKPKVYFEEWDSPIITAIEWVSEIIRLSGGNNIFDDISCKSLAKDRIIDDSKVIIKKNPDIILVSWCGKKFKKEKMTSRRGWDKINAVKNDLIYEIPSEIILQPGPASLTDGLNVIHTILKSWQNNT
tara:strand:- start:108 stop:914 length:807 start_codon:yes stop_codon:yes gene_type:complete